MLDHTPLRAASRRSVCFGGLTVVRKRAAILELLAGEDKTLLVGGDTLLVLDLGLDVVDSVGRLDLEGDGLAREAVVSGDLACRVGMTYVLTKICIAVVS